MNDTEQGYIDSQNDQANGYSELESVGDLLRNRRLEEGLSIEEVSNTLFIDKSHIYSLENDKFKEVGSKVFVLGYVKSYARYLKLDEAEIIAKLNPHLKNVDHTAKEREVKFIDGSKNSSSKIDYSRAHFNLKDSKKFNWLIYLSLILIALVFGLFFAYEFLQNKGNEVDYKYEEVETKIFTSPEDTHKKLVPSPQVSETIEENNPGEELVDIPADNIEVRDNNNLDTIDRNLDILPTENIQENNSELKSNQRRLIISFSGNSWVRVVNASNEEVVSQIYNKEDVLNLIVETPASIIIGNVNNTNVTVNGEDYDFSSFVRGQVARFIIGE